MLAGIYDGRNLLEQCEVFGFRFGLKREPFEKRKHLLYEFNVIRHNKVMDPITPFLQSAALQIFLQKQKIGDISLGYVERKHYLPLEFVIRSLAERNVEASLAITESGQIPSQILRIDWRCVHASSITLILRVFPADCPHFKIVTAQYFYWTST